MATQTKIHPTSSSGETKVPSTLPQSLPQSNQTSITSTAPIFYRASFTRPPSISLDLFKVSVNAMKDGIARNPFAHHDSSSLNPKPKCKCEVSRHKFAFCADCKQQSIPLLQIAKEEKKSKFECA